MRTFAIRIVQALILTCAIAIVIAKGMALSDVRAQDALIAAPSSWVPFVATMTRTDAQDPPAVGRFFRGADGSTRMESGPSLDDVRVIDIKNVARERTYRFAAGKGWFENPMKLREPLMPPMFKTGALASAARMNYESLPALQRVTKDGRSEVMVPQLNFFVVDRVLPEGSRVWFHDIQLNASIEPALFLPPPGVPVTYRANPAGIVEHGPEDTQIDPNTGRVTFSTP